MECTAWFPYSRPKLAIEEFRTRSLVYGTRLLGKNPRVQRATGCSTSYGDLYVYFGRCMMISTIDTDVCMYKFRNNFLF